LISEKYFVQENPEKGKRILKSLIEAEDYLSANPEEFKQFLMSRFELEEDYVDYIFTKEEFKVILEQDMLFSFEDQAEWRIRYGLSEDIEPDYRNFVYPYLLNEIDSTRTSIK
jgi:ABC-type nitrate/sulfonate/bicarbonate transport system substrate-binding protein